MKYYLINIFDNAGHYCGLFAVSLLAGESVYECIGPKDLHIRATEAQFRSFPDFYRVDRYKANLEQIKARLDGNR